MIIICDYCKQYVCPSSCPSFSGTVISLGTSRGRCFCCEANVYEGEKHFARNGNFLCEDCARELIPPELLDFLQCSDAEEFFDLLW